MSRILFFIVLLTFTLSQSLVAGKAEAAECKGKSKSACSSASDCSWVDGYKRKDGVKVKSFCRSAPGKKAKTKATKARKKAKGKVNSKKDEAQSHASDMKKKASSKKAAAKMKANKSTKSAKKKAKGKADDAKAKAKKTAKKNKSKAKKAAKKASKKKSDQ